MSSANSSSPPGLSDMSTSGILLADSRLLRLAFNSSSPLSGSSSANDARPLLDTSHWKSRISTVSMLTNWAWEASSRGPRDGRPKSAASSEVFPVYPTLCMGLHRLRTRADRDQLASEVSPGSKVTVVGRAYVGLEVAATTRKLGAEVCLVEAAPRLLARMAGPEIADFFVSAHTSQHRWFIFRQKSYSPQPQNARSSPGGHDNRAGRQGILQLYPHHLMLCHN
jgi:Pyridine nucleotide-disulphide oxidoreductase